MTGLGAQDQAKRGPEDIAAILSRWLTSGQAKERQKDDGIFRRWSEIVGPERAALSRPVRCAGGVLTVEVASAPLLHELGAYLREEVLRAIRERPELGPIAEVRFRAGAGPGEAGSASGQKTTPPETAARGAVAVKRGGTKRAGKKQEGTRA